LALQLHLTEFQIPNHSIVDHNMAPRTAVVQHSRLLSLPPELRNTISEHVLDEFDTDKGPAKELIPGLLNTCKEIYAMVLPMYLSKSLNVELTIRGTNVTPCIMQLRDFAKLNVQATFCLRLLTIRTSRDVWACKDGKPDFRPWEALIREIKASGISLFQLNWPGLTYEELTQEHDLDFWALAGEKQLFNESVLTPLLNKYGLCDYHFRHKAPRDVVWQVVEFRSSRGRVVGMERQMMAMFGRPSCAVESEFVEM
jgi:hypothetical protein